ncbi:MAG: GNAT family N-acetyltransferase [Candidatus Eisenbacteria bacterium]|nr:GNAT family N-acetyltransferase [Candidatus Eisenbacteria bacterium]
MIRYTTDLEGLDAAQLDGFFEGWPNPPSPERHLDILRESYRVVLAVDEEKECVVGFSTAVSDGVLAAYIPLLEVLPGYRGHGIGRSIMERMLNELEGLYMIDLVATEGREAFYERLGFRETKAMVRRDFDAQCGRDKKEPGD